MNKSIKKKTLTLLLVAVFSLMAVSPLFASAQTVPFGDDYHHGPYVDKILFRVLPQEDQRVLALQDNEIDLIDEQLDPQYLPPLQATENIEIGQQLRNGYGYVTINTAKYPLNITALRRAIAFAVDKEAISDDVWEGLSQPQDSCIPVVNPWTIEGQLPYTYYEANIAKGNQLLDDAEFEIPEGETYRRAPDGSEFDLLIECASSSDIAIDVGAIIAQACQDLHINARSEPTDFYEYLNRLYFHGDYDIVFLGSSFTTFDVDWLAYEFWSEYADEPYWNFPNFRNASYDAWREQLLHSVDYDEVYEAAIEMQKIWVYECPYIICYENIQLIAYRNDRFEGHSSDVLAGAASYWTNQKIRLKASEGGPWGGTFRWSNALDVDSFNFMVTTSGYSRQVLDEFYDSLMTIDPDGNDVMWLAESYIGETHADNPDVPEGYTRFTFEIIQNATWTDGHPLTAEDIAFSLNYFRDAPGNQYGSDLTEMTAAYAPTPYQLVVEFGSESYWHLHNVAYKPVIPKHIFLDIGLDGWNTWNPRPPADTMVTSGPFNVSDYVEGEFIEISRNPNYFWNLEEYRTTETPTGPTDGGGPDLTLAIIAGAVAAAVVILVGGYVLIRQR